MITEEQVQAIIAVAKRYPAVLAVYLFGSRVSGEVGPLSDYDIAVYCDNSLVHGNGGAGSRTDLRLGLAADLGTALRSDRVDLVILNIVDAPALKYNIIVTGCLLFERNDSRLLIEPRIMNEYFDFQTHLIRHGLTKAVTA